MTKMGQNLRPKFSWLETYIFANSKNERIHTSISI